MHNDVRRLGGRSLRANATYVEFQNSTLTGSGNAISVTRLPVVTVSGTTTQTTYEDVTIQFDVAADGTLTIAPGFPQYTKSPTPIASKFIAGEYVGPSTVFSGTALITVSGPSVGPGGSTQWTITTPTGAASCTYPNSATWTVVSSIASNPLAARLKAAGITSNMYMYGTGSSECTNGYNWNAPSTLLGFSQVGPSLTIYSYTYDNGAPTDSNDPVSQITYCLVGSPNCPTAQ